MSTKKRPVLFSMEFLEWVSLIEGDNAKIDIYFQVSDFSCFE
jgi:hypothetical protein